MTHCRFLEMTDLQSVVHGSVHLVPCSWDQCTAMYCPCSLSLLLSTDKTLSGVLHCLYVTEYAELEREIAWRKECVTSQTACWCCFIKTSHFDSLLHALALQEAAGRWVPPSQIDLLLLQLGTVVMMAQLVRHIYPSVLLLTASCCCSSHTATRVQVSCSRTCPSGWELLKQLEPDLSVGYSPLVPARLTPCGIFCKAAASLKQSLQSALAMVLVLSKLPWVRQGHLRYQGT